MTVSARRTALLFRARDQLCALPLAAVRESMRPLPLTVLAGMPDFVLGAALIRGAPAAVLDAGRLTGADGPGAPSHFLLMRTEKSHAALAVEALLGPREIPAAVPDLPPLLRDAAAIAGLARLDGDLLLLLESAALLAALPDEVAA